MKRGFAYGSKLDAPPIEVRHSLLSRATTESAYRSVCPSCHHGILLVRRDELTMKLQRDDRCISCGQAVRYLDAAINGEEFEG